MKKNTGDSEKLTIGLIMEDVSSEFSKEVIHGLLACVQRDERVRLVVLSGRQNMNTPPDSKQYLYREIYNTIYRLGGICHFDGLILSLPNMGEREKNLFGKEYFNHFSQIPKICIASGATDETTVNYDNETGLKEAIDYLVNTCNVTHFAMLGGRDDNPDAVQRRHIFENCLAKNRLTFTEDMYEATDMSSYVVEEAGRLLDRNPNVQAIFCVNDPVASGLYLAMEQRKLVPGRDIFVFAFDNTRLCSSLVPSLASIGPDQGTLGQCAYDALMDKISGKKVDSIVIPTRLFGRESCPYEKYEYSLRELMRANPQVIDRMFDDCFYRYKNEYIDSRSINLKRLFYEIVYRMLVAVRNRYMSDEEYEEIGQLIDVFFTNDAPSYTDPLKLLNSIDRLQTGIAKLAKGSSSGIRIHSLFTRMKDRIIQSQAGQRTRRNIYINSGRAQMLDFLLETVDYRANREEVGIETVLKHFNHLGLPNVGLFLYDTPVEYNHEGETILPETINLSCVLKSGELYLPDSDRKRCRLSKMFEKKELPTRVHSFIPFPLFYGPRIYGLLVCDLSAEIADRGEYIASILSRAIYLNDPSVIRSTGEIYKAQEVKIREQRQATFYQIAEGLASHYDIILYVNSQTGQYREYVKNAVFGSLSLQNEGHDFFEECQTRLASVIHAEDRDRMSQMITRDRLITDLENHKQLQVDYRILVDGTPKYTRMTIMWGSDKAHFIIGIVNIDDEVRREKEQIQALNRANEMARRDGLTGAKNITAYREIEHDLQSRIDEQKSNKTTGLHFAIVVCDINNLKMINDSLGHQAGDEYIKTSCKLIFDTFAHSPVYRIGGDEFVAVLMGSDYDIREQLISRIRDQVIHHAKCGEGPVVAAGLAVFSPETDNLVSDVFQRADKIMYANKNQLKKVDPMNRGGEEE